MNQNNEIAECAGLWLAEGDNKTTKEITFTNNCVELVKYFRKTLEEVFKKERFNPRVYVFLPQSDPNFFAQNDFPNCVIKYYVDKRANKPYYLYRFYNPKIVANWKTTVENILENFRNDIDVLRGFFAGEGNIKHTKTSYALRIAQGRELFWLEDIFKRIGLKFKYFADERAYNIVGRIYWDTFAEYKIPDLHPIKKKRFYDVYSKFKEYHYSPNYLKEEIYKLLTKPLTFHDFKQFNRKLTTIQDVLFTLHKEKLIKLFRIKNRSYWVQASFTSIVISDIKKKYLDAIKEPKTTTEVAKFLDVSRKAANKALTSLVKLNLAAKRNEKWHNLSDDKEIIIIP